jgi:antirestriction protein ArdC
LPARFSTAPGNPSDFDAIASAEVIMGTYLGAHDAPEVAYGGSRACYSPSADKVSLPERSSFESAEAFYSTAFHELTHSTGHASRLARKDLLEFHRFGDASYSREELVAEMGAAMLSGSAGIHQTTVPQSAAYLDSWLRVLRGDSRMIVTAAAQAQRAADLVRGISFEDQKHAA